MSLCQPSLPSLAPPNPFNSKVGYLYLISLSCSYLTIIIFSSFFVLLLFVLTLSAGRFNDPLPILPSSLTHLDVGSYFTHSLDSLPASLTHLSVGCWTYTGDVAKLPRSLTYLSIMSYGFCQPLHNLPPSLTSLSLCYGADQDITSLPKSLTFLKLGNFSKPVNTLPPSLTSLKFFENGNFNQSIDQLPPSLTALGLSDRFNQPINHLPQVSFVFYFILLFVPQFLFASSLLSFNACSHQLNSSEN